MHLHEIARQIGEELAEAPVAQQAPAIRHEKFAIIVGAGDPHYRGEVDDMRATLRAHDHAFGSALSDAAAEAIQRLTQPIFSHWLWHEVQHRVSERFDGAPWVRTR